MDPEVGGLKPGTYNNIFLFVCASLAVLTNVAFEHHHKIWYFD
jgi:hypothetical protein